MNVYKLVSSGLKEMEVNSNPYKVGTVAFWVYHTVACMSLSDQIKINSVKTLMPICCADQTISEVLRRMVKDNYLKFESKNCLMEHIYVKKGQLKGV
jgi:hypothetical protein